MRKRKKLGFIIIVAVSLCLVLHAIIEVFSTPSDFLKSLPISYQEFSKNFIPDATFPLSHFLNEKRGKTVSFSNSTVNCVNKKCLSGSDDIVKPKILIAMPTPKGFFDISKVKANKFKKLSSIEIHQPPQKAFPEDDPKSPKKLQERATLSPHNSTLANFMRIQKGRRELMLNVCRDEINNNSLHPVGAPNIFQNVIIDREDFLSFCPIYKAASTSWSIILVQMRGLWKETKKKNVQIQRLLDQIFQRVSNLIAPWVTVGTMKFLIVRHPFERLVSCYRDKFEAASKTYYYFRYGEKMMRMFRPKPPNMKKEEILLLLDAVKKRLEQGSPVLLPGNPYANPVGPTFEEFIRYVIYGKYDDDHWRPYYLHCAVCQMKYNFILRFEQLSSDSLQFLEYLNRTDVAGTRWDNPTSDGSTTRDVVCKYLSKIDSQLLKILIKKYKNDFKLFDYSYDSYLNCTKENI